MTHRIEVEDGAEYEGETYITCACGAKFTQAHQGWEALRAFLAEHGFTGNIDAE